MPLPSIFFIGTQGQPIDIVTGVIASSQELFDRIKIVADRAQIKMPNVNLTSADSNTVGPSLQTNTAGPSTESTSVSANPREDVVCEDGVCRKVTNPAETSGPSETAANTKALEEKMKIAKELLEKKKKDKENEEAKVGYDLRVVGI